MKKPVAVILLAVLNTLIIYVLGFTAMLLYALFGGFGIAADVLLLAGHIVLAVLLQKTYQKRGWLSPVKFWLCAAAPAAVISLAGYFIVMWNGLYGFGDVNGALEELEDTPKEIWWLTVPLSLILFLYGLFADLALYLSALFMLIYSGAFLAVLAVVLLCRRLKMRRRAS